MVNAQGGDSPPLGELSCFLCLPSVVTTYCASPHAMSAPGPEWPMCTAMLLDLFPGWATWVARDGWPSGFLSLQVFLLIFFNFRPSLFTFLAFSCIRASSLRLWVLITAIATLARFGSYEGNESVYLCRLKTGLGLTYTSNSHVPPQWLG